MAKIKVYSTPTCPWCMKLKDWLKENNIEFENVDVSADQDGLKEMMERSGQMGVPQTLVGDQMIVGFDPDKIKSALDSQTASEKEIPKAA